MATRLRFVLASTLILGLTGAGAMLFAPKPSPASECVYKTDWARSAWLETLRVDGEDVEFTDSTQDIFLQVSSYDHLPNISRDERTGYQGGWHCYWQFKPLATEQGLEVQP